METQLTAADVAAYMVDKSSRAIGILPMQNILYNIQGVHFGLQGKALFPDDFVASKHGAIIPEFYQKHRHHPSLWLHPDEIGNKELLTDEASVYIVDKVFNRFIIMSTSGLREFIKQEQPWEQAYENTRDQIITKESMRDYYTAML